MSPPEAPAPDTAFGWPRYSSAHPDAPLPPRAPRPRHSSLPLPKPFSEPRKTLSTRETWIAGSPAMFVPQPLPPILLVPSCPYEKLPTVSAAVALGTTVMAASVSAAVATIGERMRTERRLDTRVLLSTGLQSRTLPIRRHTRYPLWRRAKRPRAPQPVLPGATRR